MFKNSLSLAGGNLKQKELKKREEEKEKEDLNVAVLPENVKEYFYKLSSDLKKEIFPKKEDKIFEDSSLEDLLKILKMKDIEQLLSGCFLYLFHNCRLADRILEGDFEKEVSRFFNLMWSNRVKSVDEIKLFNEEYYKEFEQKFSELINKIKETESEIKKEESKLTKRKQGYNKKRQEKIRTLKTDVRGFNKALDKLERDYDVLYVSMKERKYLEKIWTEILGVTLERLTVEEFAAFFLEQADYFLFFSERSFVRRFRGSDKKKKELKGKLDLKIESFEELVIELAEGQDNKEAILVEEEIEKMKKKETRKQKLIDYFKALYSSYIGSKEKGKSDKDLTAEINYMINALNILAKNYN